MIAVLPGSPAFAVLSIVATYPGELDAEAVAMHLWPPPRLTAPLPSAEAWKARAEAVEAHRRLQATRASRLLGRLTEAGYVERVGRPVLARWFVERVERFGLGEAMCRAHPAWPRSSGNLHGHLQLAREAEKGPLSARALLGDNPSGSRKRDYAELCAWGVIVPPSHQTATAAGVALVARVAA